MHATAEPEAANRTTNAMSALWPGVFFSIALVGIGGLAGTGPLGFSPEDAPSQWKLVFADAFDGNTLDAEKWTTCYWWARYGCTNLANKEMQWYRPENVSVAHGMLVLEARESLTRINGTRYDYSSGMVTTGRTALENRYDDRFSFKYGYVEVRARIPSGAGLWPAIWLLPSDHDSIPEIDIMEVLGHAPDVLEMHYHSRVNGAKQADGTNAVVGDLSTGWHDYAVEWSPQAIVWRLDGKEIWRYTDRERIAGTNQPMYLLINLAVGGDWPGPPDEKTRFPARFLIDHVKIWQRVAQ